MAPAMTPAAAETISCNLSMISPIEIKAALNELRFAVTCGYVKPQTFNTIVKLAMEYGPISFQLKEEPSLKDVVSGAWISWAEARGEQLELPGVLAPLDGL